MFMKRAYQFRPPFRALIAFIACLYATYTWYRYAWTFEDVFITYRVIDNFLEGYGLRWNIAERVQAFTHPLWLFLLTPIYAFTKEVVLTTAVVSAVCTACTLFILYTSRLYRSINTQSALILILFSTSVFPTYSSSGFENPLSHLLICLFVVEILKYGIYQNPGRISLLAALGMLNRLDLAVFYLPVLLAVVAFQRRALRRVVLGCLPLIFWELFSLLYYGAFIPNTAYAKVPYGIDKLEIIEHGFYYVADLLVKDSLAFGIIVSSLLYLVSVMTEIRMSQIGKVLREPLVLVNIGTYLYCFYIIWVGGDYLSYRFWSIPLFTSAVTGALWMERITPTSPVVLQRRFFGVIFTMLLMGKLGITQIIREVKPDIADDRVNTFFRSLQLPNYIHNGFNVKVPWRDIGTALREQGEASEKLLIVQHSVVGLIGYYAGPKVHILDINALTEPLLARLPSKPGMRIGHFSRDLPSGYLEWIRGERTALLSPSLRAYLTIQERIIRKPIFSWQRLRELVPFALGYYDRELRKHVMNKSSDIAVSLSAVQQLTNAGSNWNDYRNIIIPPEHKLVVLVSDALMAKFIEVAVDCNDLYDVTLHLEGTAEVSFTTPPGVCDGMNLHRFAIPVHVRNKLLRHIVIRPHAGDLLYSVGHVLLLDE